MIAPREVLAAEARKLIEFHGEDWDSMHALISLHWDDAAITYGTWMAIDLAISPARFPALITGAARERLDKHADDPPPYAWAFLGEFFGMTEPRPGDTAEYRDRFDRARRDRTMHEQPDATESAIAWVADVHGRLWQAAMIRGRDGIHENFYAPGRARRGGITDALIQAACVTGIASGLTAPPGQGWN